jgi:hypothetical protein
MTKKDFELIAETIQSTWRKRLVAHKHGPDCVCSTLANALQKKNPRFQRGKFLVACLPPEDACEKFVKDPGFDSPGYCKNCGLSKSDHG